MTTAATAARALPTPPVSKPVPAEPSTRRRKNGKSVFGPAINENVARPSSAFDLPIVAKTIAAGICAAGIALIERQNGLSSTLAKRGTEVMTADEVAAFLRLDRKTVYDYAGRGVIPCQRLGKRMLFSRDAIELWLRSCCKGLSESSSE